MSAVVYTLMKMAITTIAETAGATAAVVVVVVLIAESLMEEKENNDEIEEEEEEEEEEEGTNEAEGETIFNVEILSLLFILAS